MGGGPPDAKASIEVSQTATAVRMKRTNLSALLLLAVALPTIARNGVADDLGDASHAAPLAAPTSASTPAATSADSGPPASSETSASASTVESICLMIEAAAIANGLPPAFFAGLIWQESSFSPDAVGPITRSGQRAEGIAQFMPGTASERQLLDPFDPVQALPKSAEFLRELLEQFGNLGLAAAAYNAGPKRVHDWIAHQGGLPRETRNYVRTITGISVDDWVAVGRDMKPSQINRSRPGCRELTAGLRTPPNLFVAELEKRVSDGGAKPWGVELSASFSRTKALNFYSAAESRYGALLAGHDPSILRTRNRNRGTGDFYQIRVGADTRLEANKLCASLRAAGGACMVLRNPHSGA
jgi:soluble lytic murein transglycosylase-like protein